MKTINDKDIVIAEDYLSNEIYNFQPKLTRQLDLISSDFNQDIINQIVLWKVNRFVDIDSDTFELLNQVDKSSHNIDIELTKKILERLLSTKGIKLAMASTILRFKNPKNYQIIDQRVYRFITGENMPMYLNSIDAQINLYLNYLQNLKEVCKKKQIEYELSDRIIYALDKKFNGDLKIKY